MFETTITWDTWTKKAGILLLTMIFMVSPGSAMEPIVESADFVEEVYLHSSSIIGVSSPHLGSSPHSVRQTTTANGYALSITPECKPVRGKIYILHSCLKLLD